MKKINIVKESKDFQKIIKNNKSFRTKYFYIYKQNHEENIYHFGLSVGKKIGNAVERNRIKRLITAVIDNLNIDLDSSTDVFIIARVQIKELSYSELKKQLEYLFRKQKLIKGEKNG